MQNSGANIRQHCTSLEYPNSAPRGPSVGSARVHSRCRICRVSHLGSRPLVRSWDNLRRPGKRRRRCCGSTPVSRLKATSVLYPGHARSMDHEISGDRRRQPTGRRQRSRVEMAGAEVLVAHTMPWFAPELVDLGRRAEWRSDRMKEARC
jgi:hypothetical protein